MAQKVSVIGLKKAHPFNYETIVRDEDIEYHLDNNIPKGQIGILATQIIWLDITVSLLRSLFICQRCGWCCSKCDVQLFDAEIPIIANYLNVRTRKIRHMINENNYFKKNINKGLCPFLKDNNCTIYPVRPISCMLYPFIPVEPPSFSNIGKNKAVIGIVQCKGARIMTPRLTKMIDSIRDIQNNNREISKEDIKHIVEEF